MRNSRTRALASAVPLVVRRAWQLRMLEVAVERAVRLGQVRVGMVADSDKRSEFEPEDENPFEDRPAQNRLSDAELEAEYDAGTFRVVSQLNNFPMPAILQAIGNQQYLNVHPKY